MAVARLPRVAAPPAPAAAAAAPPGGGGSPTPPAPPATAPRHGADLWATLGCVALFGVALLVAIFWKGSHGPNGSVPAEGLSAFALFYVAAFVVERFLEPFASLEVVRPAKQERDRDHYLNVAHRAADTDPAMKDAALAKAAEQQDAIDRWRANRALVVLGLATVLGVLLAAYLQLRFLATVGVTQAPDWLQVFATALVIGGGTKPLHDLITRIQKAKDNAKTPSEVGGNA